MSQFDKEDESMVENYADQYVDKYHDQMEAFTSSSLLAKSGATITPSDV